MLSKFEGRGQVAAGLLSSHSLQAHSSIPEGHLQSRAVTYLYSALFRARKTETLHVQLY